MYDLGVPNWGLFIRESYYLGSLVFCKPSYEVLNHRGFSVSRPEVWHVGHQRFKVSGLGTKASPEPCS